MELLTVMAIIGILFIIVAPRVQYARLRAVSASCRNNIRQYGVALNQLMEANKGFFITPTETPPPTMITLPGGQFLTSGGVRDTGGIGPADPGMEAARTWIGQLVFPYIYNLTNTYSGLNWWNYTRFLPQQIPFFNDPYIVGLHTNIGKIIMPDDWPTYCPVTLNSLVIFTTRRTNLFTIPNNELWAVNNPKGYKGFGMYEVDPEPDMGRYTTYAINASFAGSHRGEIPGNVIAFSDWNHIYGWWANVQRDRAMWGFNNYRIGATEDADKPVNSLGCFTEVGFHHPVGEQMAANAMLFDGTIVTIVSNQANSNVYWQ